ncbi:hypothetical protein [Natrialba aegyptia]|nr:hypothetical protein [Natrialba aegyptia]
MMLIGLIGALTILIAIPLALAVVYRSRPRPSRPTVDGETEPILDTWTED